MLKSSHINVAVDVYNTIQRKLNWKLNKAAFIFGSVAPDINCIYPVHTLKMTLNRFEKRIERVRSSDINLIKSFTLGVVMHYLCDYFCYAHNLNRTDPKHAIYERIMRKHIKKHMDKIAVVSEDIQNKIEDVFKSIWGANESNIEHTSVDKIIDIVETMHDEYIHRTSDLDSRKWYMSIPKIELDVAYSRFMCERVALMI